MEGDGSGAVLTQNGSTMGALHEDFFPLITRQLTGELPEEEKQVLQGHLHQCAHCSSAQQDLTRTWRELEILQVPEIPAELYQNIRDDLLTRVKQSNAPLGRFVVRAIGMRTVLLPLLAGAVIGTISYALIHNLARLPAQRHYVVIPLFFLWSLLFAGGAWLVLNKRRIRRRLDRISAYAIIATLLTLIIACIAYEVDGIRWLATSAFRKVVIGGEFLFGNGGAFIASWWIYCCLASFLGALFSELCRTRALSAEAIWAGFATAILISPAVYLQGISHSHASGVIIFAVLGTALGSLIGAGTGSFLNREMFSRVS